MLEIKETENTEKYPEIAERAEKDVLHITEALDRGNVIGFIAYSYDYMHERTVVYDYDDSGDIMLCDGLVRSVMLKSVMKNIDSIIFDIPDTEKYDSLRKLKFLSGQDRQCNDLNSFMNACEHCKNKE